MKRGPRQLDVIYERISVWALYALAFLVPVMYLPWTVDPLEINKQTALLLLTAVAVLSWLGMIIARKQFLWKRSWLFLLPVLFLVSALASSSLSIAPVVSWVGQSSQEYTSFLTLTAFVAMFVIGSHALGETRVQRGVWSASLLSSGLVSILTFLDLANIFSTGTNFIGTPSSLGHYLAAMAVLGSGLLLVTGEAKKESVLPGGWFGKLVTGCIFLTLLGAFVVALAIDAWPIWVALIAGLGLLFTFSLIRAAEFPRVRRFLAPMLLFAASLIFLFFSSPVSGRYAIEVSPSYSSSWQIAQETWGEHGYFFGSGPGTFVMDYTEYHREDVNQTIFWDTRFDRSVSHFFTMLVSLGIVSTVLFVLFLLFLLGAALMMLLREKAHDEWKMTYVALAGWFVLSVGLFIQSTNMTLAFLFWLLSAVLVSQVHPKTWQVPFRESPRFALASSFLFILVSVGIVTLMFVTVSRYGSEVAFAKAVNADAAGAPLEEVLVDLDAAASLNRWSDIYYRNLGNALLLQTAEIIEDPEVDPEYVRALVSSSLSAATRSVEISPSNVVNWSLLGDIYREVAPLVGDADLFAISSYQEAIDLAPVNPKYRVALAKAYLVRADQLSLLTASDDEAFAEEADEARIEALSLAEESLLAAIELKPDYGPAHYELALVYTRQGNLADAIARLEALRAASPLDVGIGFQLGLLYLQQGKADLAKAELERIIEISPNYSNALWYLSVVYEQLGDIDGAIEMVEAVLVQNPDNVLALQRLEDLESGEVSDEIPEPVEEGDEDVVEDGDEVVVGE